MRKLSENFFNNLKLGFLSGITKVVKQDPDLNLVLTKAAPFEEMLAYYRKFHPEVVQEFSTITSEELDLPSVMWEEINFPIRHRLHRYEAHLIQHTVQVDKTLAAIGQSPSETKD